AEAAYADLTGFDRARVAGLMRQPRGTAALHRRAGLPEPLLPAFEAALTAWREASSGASTLSGAGLSRRMIERALTACEDMPFGEMQAVTALLARYEAEAARDEARTVARSLAEAAQVREAARQDAERLETEWRAAQVREAEPVALERSEAVPARIAALPAPEAASGSDAIGAVLDTLPDALLASFRAEQEHLRRDAEAAHARDAAEAVLETIPDALIASYREDRARMRLAA
ncbi:MAG TPA: hypothetical protein VGN94_05025, partial [Methylobacterium sp.]|nr:hypothetical protein [Methylobacterium sp.]